MSCSGCQITYSGVAVSLGLIDHLSVDANPLSGSGVSEYMGVLDLYLNGNDGKCVESDVSGCIAVDPCKVVVEGEVNLTPFFNNHPNGLAYVQVTDPLLVPIFTSPVMTAASGMPYTYPIFDKKMACGSSEERLTGVVLFDPASSGVPARTWLWIHSVPMGCSDCE